MIVVSDVTLINYLVLIGEAELLGRLFGAVHLPTEVVVELQAPNAPKEVKAWISSRPAWVHIMPVGRGEDSSLKGFDQGERDALRLAKAIGADVFLTDDLEARKAAKTRGLVALTTLLILEEADRRGWMDLKDVVLLLRTANFRVSQRTLLELLRRNVRSS